ncbi:MAG TPA: hypothetical protein VGR47_09080 [Terracidiphilus sp.]|nr:hypothetical protein [Terracidiphilus sp.]
MEPALRPMSLGEILDRTAQLYRGNFLLFAGIFVPYAGWALTLGLLSLGLREWMQAAHLTRALLIPRLTVLGVEWLLLFLAAGAAVAATNRAVAWVHLGEPATIRGAYRSILPRLGRYLGLMTIVFFVVWTPMGLLYLGLFGAMRYFNLGQQMGAAGGQHPHMDPHTAMVFGIVFGAFGLLMIPAVVYAVLMGLRYALALPACVLEDLKTGKALRRGIDLSKGARGRIFVLGLLVGVIKLGVVSISQAFFFVSIFKHHGQVSAGVGAISQVIGFFTNTFLGPIYATGITLLYYDQRVRHEGYDIEWMMQSAGLSGPAQQATEDRGQGRADWEPGSGSDRVLEPGQGQEPEGAHG